MSKAEYQPILDPPNRNAHDDMVDIEVHNENISESYQYRSTADGSSYQQAPPMTVPHEATGSRVLPPPYASPYISVSSQVRGSRGYRDSLWVTFFITYLGFVSFGLLRVVFVPGGFHTWWNDSTYPWWTIFVCVVNPICVSYFWLYIAIYHSHSFQKIEKIVSVSVVVISTVVFSYGWPGYEFGYYFIPLIWLFGVVRLAWNHIVSSEDDSQFTAFMVHYFRPQIMALLLPATLAIMAEAMWLGWWSFCFSFASIVYVNDNYFYWFPTLQAALLVLAVWTLLVLRSFVLAIVGASLASWYKGGGSNAIQPFACFSEASRSLGSIIFAGVFVDFFAFLSWLFYRLHNVLYFHKPRSWLMNAAQKIETFSNPSCFAVMISESQPFVAASKSASRLLHNTSIMPALQANTLKYSAVFCSIQSMILTTTAIGRILPSVLSFLISMAIMGIIYGAVVTLLTCYAQDAVFLQSHYPGVSNEIDKKTNRDNINT